MSQSTFEPAASDLPLTRTNHGQVVEPGPPVHDAALTNYTLAISGMADGLKIPEMTSSDAAWASRILGVARQVFFAIGDANWMASFAPPIEPAGSTVVRLLAGETSIWVALSDWNALLLTSPFCEGVVLEDLPGEIAAAVIEAACGPILDQLSNVTGQPWTVLEVAVRGVSPHPWKVGIVLTDASGTAIQGAVSVDAGAIPFLGDLIDRIPPTALMQSPRPPLVAAVEIGMTSLPVTELKSLKLRDVVLMDVTAFRPDGQGVIRTSKSTAWRVKVDGDRATLTEPRVVAPSPQLPVDSPVVNVLFEYGDVVIAPETAGSLEPGQTLEVANSQCVRLSIDGKPFATGELIEVASKLGVRLLEVGTLH